MTIHPARKLPFADVRDMMREAVSQKLVNEQTGPEGLRLYCYSKTAVYERKWRKRLIPEFRTQLALRMLVQRMSDAQLDDLFELARTDGIMPIVSQKAHFNRHRDLIVALFKHPPARKVLFRSLME